jgi:type I restriction enzyme R subunit
MCANQTRSERKTPNCFINLFINPTRPDYLGYRYLDDWSNRENNRPIETALLQDYLTDRGYSATLQNGVQYLPGKRCLNFASFTT